MRVAYAFGRFVVAASWPTTSMVTIKCDSRSRVYKEAFLFRGPAGVALAKDPGEMTMAITPTLGHREIFDRD